MLGKEHPDTLTSMNNLAEVLGSQGKYEEAERINRQTLALRESVLGKENPDTLTSMNNLAKVLRNLSKYEEAKEIHRQTLALYSVRVSIGQRVSKYAREHEKPSRGVGEAGQVRRG